VQRLHSIDQSQARVYPDQRYFITYEGAEEDAVANWRKCLDILVEDLEFHEVLDQFGVKVIVDTDMSFYFDHNFTMDGIRYSRLSKAIWDKYHHVFEDYGLILMDNDAND
jgi:hypothetical protein|tara:strand:- start:251 stop:580 length:330 start_codon:yes stop_codon:yes gene_type:complete